jgi:hypothetical protein
MRKDVPVQCLGCSQWVSLHQIPCRDVPEYMKDVEFNKWSAFIESLDGAHGEDALFRS